MSPGLETEDTERKGPDKSENLEINGPPGPNLGSNNEQTVSENSEQVELKSMSNLKDEKTEPPASDVSDLNDGELRALLDEAYNYKSPKDREGKSEIFKKFLQEAETAETETQQPSLLFAEAPVRVTGSKRRSGRREIAVSERQSRCGSLQNLTQCHVEYPTSSRRSRHGGHLRRGASTSSTCSSATCESVSTRQREGGSLPCSVNAVHDLAGTNMAALRAGDVTLNVPSLEDLTSWHSTYSMPRLVNSQPDSEVGVASSEVTSDAELCARVKTSSGFENTTATKPEMKAELVTMVEAVNCEKQKIRERAEEHLNNDADEANPKYRSSMAWEINNSKPTQVDEVTDISYFRGIENFCLLQLHPTQDGNVIIPSSANVNLEISEGNAVRSVLGSNRQDVTAKSVISRGSNDRNKPPYYVSSNIQSAPHNYFQCSEPSAVVSNQQKDDNGNYVREDKQSDTSTTSAQNKKRKKEKEKNVKMTEEIEGFKGHEDLDSLLMYIEGDEVLAPPNIKTTKHKSKPKDVLCRRSHRHSEESDNSRDKRGKFKETNSTANSNLKRANSLEEVSKTKLEDFADPTDSSRSVGEGRTSQLSIDFDDEEEEEEEVAQFYSVVTEHSTSSNFKEDFYSSVLDNAAASTETDFHVVTKKQRRKKQRRPDNRNCASKPYDEDPILNFYRVKNDRRKCKSTSSMPPSDQSGDSDSDSIHSLPVSSTTKKPTIDKTSTSSGGTPQASYADIARMAGDTHKLKSRSHKNSENMEEWAEIGPRSQDQTHKSQENTHKYQESTHKSQEATHKIIKNHKNPENMEQWPDMTHKMQENAHKMQEITHKSQESSHKIIKSLKNSDNMEQWPDMTHKPQENTHKSQESSYKNVKNHKNPENMSEWPNMSHKNQELNQKVVRNHKEHSEEWPNMVHKSVLMGQKFSKNGESLPEWPVKVCHKNSEEWPEVSSNRSVSSQTLQDGKKDAMTSTYDKVKNEQTSNLTCVNNNFETSHFTNDTYCSRATPPRDVTSRATPPCDVTKSATPLSDVTKSATPPCDVTKSGTPPSEVANVYNTPAVIISANVECTSDVSGLTFGFEINDELLTNFETRSRDFASMFVTHKQQVDKQAADIVNFVGKAWDCVVSEVGHLTQVDLQCGPVQYFKCP